MFFGKPVAQSVARFLPGDAGPLSGGGFFLHVHHEVADPGGLQGVPLHRVPLFGILSSRHVLREMSRSENFYHQQRQVILVGEEKIHALAVDEVVGVPVFMRQDRAQADLATAEQLMLQLVFLDAALDGEKRLSQFCSSAEWADNRPV